MGELDDRARMQLAALAYPDGGCELSVLIMALRRYERALPIGAKKLSITFEPGDPPGIAVAIETHSGACYGPFQVMSKETSGG